jgi:hypothetical protein
VPKPKRKSRIIGRPKTGTTMLERDPSLIKKIADGIRLGLYIAESMQIHGVNYDTGRGWFIRGLEYSDTVFGEFSREIQRAISQSEMADLSRIEVHARGMPAEYEMRPSRDANGMFLTGPDGKPVMEPALDGHGNPIVKRSEIKSSWQAAAWKLERRRPQRWSRFRNTSSDDDQKFLNLDDTKPVTGTEVVSEEHKQRLYREVKEIAMSLEELEDDPFSIE